MSLEIGDPAPDFTLRSQHGEDVTLSALRGRPVLVVFFPYAFSGICTGELAELRDHLDELSGGPTGAEVLAVSCDAMFANRAFADREGLTFSVLSDFWPHGEVSRAYGVLDEASGAPERGSFLVDADGVLRWKVEHPIGEARDVASYRAALARV